MSFLIYQQDPNNEDNTVELEIDYDMDYVLNDNGTLTDEIVSWAVIAIKEKRHLLRIMIFGRSGLIHILFMKKSWKTIIDKLKRII